MTQNRAVSQFEKGGFGRGAKVRRSDTAQDGFAILIEDKTGTTNHSNQLVRYLEEVKSRKYKEKKYTSNIL